MASAVGLTQTATRLLCTSTALPLANNTTAAAVDLPIFKVQNCDFLLILQDKHRKMPILRAGKVFNIAFESQKPMNAMLALR